MDRLRGEIRGQPLTEREHTFLYERAMQGSRKDAARATGTNTNTAHHLMKTIFAKLDVEDLVSAFWVMGWLHPLPYGVSEAEVRAERLAEGESILRDFWARMPRRSE